MRQAFQEFMALGITPEAASESLNYLRNSGQISQEQINNLTNQAKSIMK
jgi:hypothetical protein